MDNVYINLGVLPGGKRGVKTPFQPVKGFGGAAFG